MNSPLRGNVFSIEAGIKAQKDMRIKAIEIYIYEEIIGIKQNNGYGENIPILAEYVLTIGIKCFSIQNNLALEDFNKLKDFISEKLKNFETETYSKTELTPTMIQT